MYQMDIPNSRDLSSPGKAQVGFSLIEVLVSVFVLAVGLLGLANLQITSLKINQEAEQRSMAISQINEMADRMRANPVGITAGDYNNLSGPPSLPTCNPCSPTQIASRDFSIWNVENAQLLSSGQGKVSNVGLNLFDIILMWDSLRTGATGTNCGGNPTVDLTCITMRIEL